MTPNSHANGIPGDTHRDAADIAGYSLVGPTMPSVTGITLSRALCHAPLPPKQRPLWPVTAVDYIMNHRGPRPGAIRSLPGQGEASDPCTRLACVA